MRRRARPGFRLVAAREWRWIRRDRLAPILIFGVPLLAYIVLMAVFSNQVIRGLGVVVVDDDRSQTSAIFVEALAASPNLKIVQRSTDLTSASRAMRSGNAIAAVYIPSYFERDLKAERRPQVVAFYNQQPLTASGIASQGLSDAITAAAASVSPTSRSGPTAPQTGTLAVQNIVLVNPERNYAQFLLRALLPMVLHVVIAISAGYAVGSEFRRRSLRTWLACAGGNPIVALAGKLAPLFMIFVVMMLLMTFIIEGLFDISFRGHAPMMIAAAFLLIAAYLALGALCQLLLRDLAAGLSVTGLIVSPAFGYAGVGFPIVGMNAFAQTWSAFLPLRWYMAVLFGQAARGLPTQASAKPFAFLAMLAVAYALLALWRLNAISKRPWIKPVPEAVPVIEPVARGAGGAFAAEWKRMLTDRGAFAMMVIAPLIYAIYYPQPYLTQILRKIPIAVVDNDLSELSRNIIDTVDGSGTLSVAVRANTLEEARRALDRGDVFAILGIPPDTQRDVLKGTDVPLPFYADATYLFIYRSVSPGIAAAVGAVSTDLIARGARSDGSLAKAALASSSPADILLQPIFNPVGGYASYIVPAAFVLILQQTLLMGAAMLTGPRLGEASIWAVWHRTRPCNRAPDHLSAGATALSGGAAAPLWVLRAWPHPRVGHIRCAVSPRNQFHGAGRGRVVQAPRDRRAPLPRDQHSAALPGRICLAARGNSRPRARREPYLPVRLCNLRPHPPQPDGGGPFGRGAGLARIVDHDRGVFRAGAYFGAAVSMEA